MSRWDGLRKLERNKLLQQYAAEHPNLGYREIGKVFGISESRAWRILNGNKKSQ